MKTIVVAAAVIERGGAYLLTRRLEGTHLAGAWEFPGGKCDAGEPLEKCLEREILEELGVGCRVGAPILSIAHDYPDRRIALHFFACELAADPIPCIGQEMRWVPRSRLREYELPPADAELIDLLTADGTDRTWRPA